MNRKITLPFAAVILLTFLGILALNLLTPLLADDYRYAFRLDTGARLVSVADIFPSLMEHARILNGRLVPHFFVQLFSLFPHQVFGVVNSLVYLLLLFGVYTLIKPAGTRCNWALFLLVSASVFLFPPAFGQSFLWMSGSANYLWCAALMVWIFQAFAGTVFKAREPSGVLRWGLLPLGCLLLGNMSENTSAAAVLLMGLCTLWVWLRRRRLSLWMALATVLAFAGWLTLMLSPANHTNLGQGGLSLNELYLRLQAVLGMWMDHALWLSMAFVAVFFFAKSAGGDPDRLFFSMAVFVCSVLCNFAMVAAPYYPDRASTGTIILLILAIGTALYALPAAPWRQALSSALAFGLTLVMVLQMAYVLPNAYNRYQLAQARVREVCAARDEGQTHITTFGIKGKTRFDAFWGLNELTDDPTYFPNEYFAKYYQLGSVVVDRFE